MTGSGEFEAWFRLLETPKLGPTHARQLLAAFGSPEAVLRAPPSSLRGLVTPALAAAIAGPAPEGFANRLRRCEGWLSGGAMRRFITLGDADYPPLLLQTADPPALLFAQGAVHRLAARSVAIVGTRHPTTQGEENARAFAAALSREGLVVVSGLARGIDAAAHEGALLGEGGTVAVLGAGLDDPYPSQNARLAARIVDQGGAVISEYAPGTPPLKENFPRRNRIIAGLSLGTLVVEAALRSGSLITARLATEAGREVFAIPGSIHSPQSKGCHALIRQGAKLVEVATDILEELRLADPAVAVPGMEGDEADDADSVDDAATGPVLRALGHDPATLDALQARTGWPTAELAAGLLELELQGKVARLPGGLYQRRAAA
ncbi:MAG: DNA-protecting protein DprA [Burkholderiales bacterium]|nr:DNA-protecting protein DprA [Burkholderiales bacterium]